MNGPGRTGNDTLILFLSDCTIQNIKHCFGNDENGRNEERKEEKCRPHFSNNVIIIESIA